MNKTLKFLKDVYPIDITQPFIPAPISREWGLLRIMRKLNFTKGAEIGVYEGLYAARICRNNPQMKFYCIDSWTEYDGYEDFEGISLKEKYQEVIERMKPYNAEVIKAFSMDAVKRFKDNSLDFVYIDAAHDFEHVYEDIREWSKKVKSGGIISGHDYGEGARSRDYVHTLQVVPAWTQAYQIHPWFVLDADWERSWMWVKTRQPV